MYKVIGRKLLTKLFFSLILILIGIVGINILKTAATKKNTISTAAAPQSKFIKYAEFNIPYKLLEMAMKTDIDSHAPPKEGDGQKAIINWIDLLAHLGAKYGGNFKQNFKQSDFNALVEKINSGQNIDELSQNMKFYSYYHQVYTAVLGEFLGEHSIQNGFDEKTGEPTFETKYGLKVFSPIAKGYPFNHYSDFGASRTYGYKRQHLGHDMMAAIGTPVIAVESGIVEVMGWNQYGGWRIGIRSFDKKRYYYYAHLRKNLPFAEGLVEGKTVKAGDVIGYIGRTGYSAKENINNIDICHLHLGLELVFDESQKESNNEIWVDLYDITKLLLKNQSAIKRIKNSKHSIRQLDFKEPNLCNFNQ